MNNTILNLDRNEYFFPHHTEVLNALRCVEEDSFSRYASQKSMISFRDELAKALSVQPERITLGHGAEDVFVKIFAWFKKRFQHLVIEDFSWTNYLHIAEGFEYQIHRIPTARDSTQGFQHNTADFDKYLSEVPPSLVLLTSPNNPTGHSISFDDLGFLIHRFPQHIFLLDIVYSHFFNSYAQQFAHLENVIVVGSFSKFFGLPGLRVGFAIGKLPEAFWLNLGLQPFVLSAGLAALKNASWYEENRNFMIAYARGLLKKEFNKLHIYKTDGPFFLAQVKIEEQNSDLEDLFKSAEIASGVKPKYLLKDGVYYFRFSLGPASVCKKIDRYLDFFV